VDKKTMAVILNCVGERIKRLGSPVGFQQLLEGLTRTVQIQESNKTELKHQRVVTSTSVRTARCQKIAVALSLSGWLVKVKVDRTSRKICGRPWSPPASDSTARRAGALSHRWRLAILKRSHIGDHRATVPINAQVKGEATMRSAIGFNCP
jgi:hypothetical protein